MKKLLILSLVLLFIFSLQTNLYAKFNLGNLVNKENLKKVAKTALVGIAVDQLAKPLDKFINQLLLSKGVPNKDATKVVPILTVGQKGHIGAAQVSGPKEAVDKVQSVIQFEDTYQKIRVKALIPNAHKVPTQLDRVYGVGVTAIIDTQL